MDENTKQVSVSALNDYVINAKTVINDLSSQVNEVVECLKQLTANDDLNSQEISQTTQTVIQKNQSMRDDFEEVNNRISSMINVAADALGTSSSNINSELENLASGAGSTNK